MNVLIACEYSGIVRDAFTKHGHYAVSCDLLPTEQAGEHYQGDVFDIINHGFDLMIAFPPCTFLCCPGLHHNNKVSGRLGETFKSLDFVRRLLTAPIKHICLENPMGAISTRLKFYSQVVNPWQFGHVEKKRTCLWLKNLPLLKPTAVIPFSERVPFLDLVPDTKNQWKIRSRTFSGIAQAMASQWSDLSTHYIQPTLFNYA